MPEARLTKLEQKLIDRCLARYAEAEYQGRLGTFLTSLRAQLSEYPQLKPLIHSTRSRIKEPGHLRRKLHRKIIEYKSRREVYISSADDLFHVVTDLVGLRILHLHTAQMREIAPAIRAALDEYKYRIVKDPIAHTWDTEYSEFFSSIGIKTAVRDSMYTSVHYVVASNSKLRLTCELQVRTLMEEVWGEVSHKIDYPEKTESVACGEQLKVLARATSTATRLVDSIFKSRAEYEHWLCQSKNPGE